MGVKDPIQSLDDFPKYFIIHKIIVFMFVGFCIKGKTGADQAEFGFGFSYQRKDYFSKDS